MEELIPTTRTDWPIDLIDETKEEIRLRGVIEARMVQIEGIEREIDQMETILQGKNADAVALIKSLMDELQELQTNMATIGKPVPTTVEDAVAKTLKHNKMLEELIKTGKKPSQRSKTLFARIAQKTHPDKTDDVEMHKLFRQARAAKDVDDVEQLAAILKSIDIKTGLKYASLLVSRLKELQAEDNATLAKLERLHRSEQYRVAQDYKNPAIRPYVERHYTQLLREGVQKLKYKIRSLAPTRYMTTVSKEWL